MHTAPDRVVYTYEPNGMPAGVITGYCDGANAFVVEHIIAFKPHVLVPMLREGLEAAGHYKHLILNIPDTHPQARGLRALAKRMGFTEYEPKWWIRYPNVVDLTDGNGWEDEKEAYGVRGI